MQSGISELWQFGGTAHISADESSLFLGVGVADRVAHLWSKEEIQTREVDIEFSFQYGRGNHGRMVHKQGFGFW
jgi:hypothetical protein